MRGADCSDLRLVKIPPNLNSNLEVLDASVNRIRVLSNDSFVHLPYLKFLYLFDNVITKIEPNAFAPLEVLSVLDLRINGITTLPAILPETLRKLYLTANTILSAHLSSAKSLEYLTLAENDLTTLPNLGILPNLQFLNLSSNPLISLDVHHLASFCHLTNLSLPTTFPKEFFYSCECVRLTDWIFDHSIYVTPLFNCSLPDDTECELNSTMAAEVFSNCLVDFHEQSAPHWAMIAGAGGLVFIFAIILTLLWRRRWKKRSERSSENGRESRHQGKPLHDKDKY